MILFGDGKKKEKKPFDKEEYQKQRKQMSMQSMYFNRFLMVRYFTAAFFFMSFYWFFLNITNGHWMMFVSGALFLFSFFPSIELMKTYSEKEPSIKWAKLYYRIVPIVLIILAILLIIFNPNEIMPFLTNTLTARITMICILLILLAMSLACAYRLVQIESKTDKQYQRILQLSKYNKM